MNPNSSAVSRAGSAIYTSVMRSSRWLKSGCKPLSNVAQRMGSSAALVRNGSASSESLDVKAARAEMELEILQADLAHREAFVRLKALLGETR